MPDKQPARISKSRRSFGSFSHRTDLKRPAPSRDQKWTVLVTSNGERTEVDYFNGIRMAGLTSAEKVLVVKFRNGAPVDTVRFAAELRDYSEYDEAWTVCDVDTFDVDAAIRLAKAKGNSVEKRRCQPSSQTRG